MQYTDRMKTATLPPVRVAPDFRMALEDVLEPGETLSQFVENAVRSVVEKRKSLCAGAWRRFKTRRVRAAACRLTRWWRGWRRS